MNDLRALKLGPQETCEQTAPHHGHQRTVGIDRSVCTGEEAWDFKPAAPTKKGKCGFELRMVQQEYNSILTTFKQIVKTIFSSMHNNDCVCTILPLETNYRYNQDSIAMSINNLKPTCKFVSKEYI